MMVENKIKFTYWNTGGTPLNVDLCEAAISCASKSNLTELLKISCEDRNPHEWPLVKIREISRETEGFTVHLDCDLLWDYDIKIVTELLDRLGIDVLYQRRESMCSNFIYKDGLKHFDEIKFPIAYNAGLTVFSKKAKDVVREEIKNFRAKSFNISSTYEQVVLPIKLRQCGLKVATLEDIEPFLPSRPKNSIENIWNNLDLRFLIKSKCLMPRIGFLHLVGNIKEKMDVSKTIIEFNELYK